MKLDQLRRVATEIKVPYHDIKTILIATLTAAVGHQPLRTGAITATSMIHFVQFHFASFVSQDLMKQKLNNITLNSSVEEQRIAISQLETSTRKQTAVLQQLEAEKANNIGEIKTLRSQLQQEQAANLRVQASLKEHVNACQELRTSQQVQYQQISAMKGEKSMLDARINELFQQLDEQKSFVNAQNTRISQFEISSMRQEESLKVAGDKNAELLRNVETLSGNLQKEQANTTRLQGLVEKHALAYDELTVALENSENAIQSLEGDKATSEKQCMQVQQQFQEERRSSTALRSTLEEQQLLLSQLESSAKQKDSMLVQMEHDKVELLAKVERVSQQIEQSKRTIEKLNCSIKDQTSAHNKLAAAQISKDEAVKHLEASKEQLLSDNSNLQSSLEEQHEAILQLESTIEQVEEKLRETREEKELLLSNLDMISLELQHEKCSRDLDSSMDKHVQIKSVDVKISTSLQGHGTECAMVDPDADQSLHSSLTVSPDRPNIERENDEPNTNDDVGIKSFGRSRRSHSAIEKLQKGLKSVLSSYLSDIGRLEEDLKQSQLKIADEKCKIEQLEIALESERNLREELSNKLARMKSTITTSSRMLMDENENVRRTPAVSPDSSSIHDTDFKLRNESINSAGVPSLETSAKNSVVDEEADSTLEGLTIDRKSAEPTGDSVVDRLKSLLETAMEMKRKLQEKNKEQTEEIEKLNSRNYDLKQKYEEKSRVDDIRIKTCKDEMNTTKAWLEKSLDEVEEVRGKLAKMTTMRDESERKNLEYSQKMEQLESELFEANQALAISEEEIDRLHVFSNDETRQDSLEEKSKDLETLKSQMELEKKKNNDLRKEVEQLKNSIEQLKQGHSDTLHKLKIAYKTEVDKYRERIQEFEKKLVDEKTELEQELASLRPKISSEKERSLRHKSEVKRLLSQLIDAKKSLKECIAEKDDLLRRLEDTHASKLENMLLEGPRSEVSDENVEPNKERAQQQQPHTDGGDSFLLKLDEIERTHVEDSAVKKKEPTSMGQAVKDEISEKPRSSKETTTTNSKIQMNEAMRKKRLKFHFGRGELMQIGVTTAKDKAETTEASQNN